MEESFSFFYIKLLSDCFPGKTTMLHNSRSNIYIGYNFSQNYLCSCVYKHMQAYVYRHTHYPVVYMKYTIMWIHKGFPGGASGKESTRQCKRCERHGFDPWIRKIPWSRKWQPTIGFSSSVQSLSHIRLFATPWTAARHTSLSITNSQSLLKLMSIKLVMPSNYLILFCPLLLLPSVFPSLRFFSKESVLHISPQRHGKLQMRTKNTLKRRCHQTELLGEPIQFSHSVVSDPLQPHEPQHARPPCPSPTPRVHPNPCPSSRWCHPTISSSVVPFSSCPQSFPASGSFPVSQLFALDG